MIPKKLLFLLSVLFVHQLHGQEVVSLSLGNPAPRVGEEVRLTLDLTFMTDQIKAQTDTRIKFLDKSFITDPDNITQNIVFQQAGEYVLGPYDFTFNGKKYQTNTLAITVADELPYQEGLWLRCVRQNDTQYLIIEQQVANEMLKESSRDVNSFSLSMTTSPMRDFVELRDLKDYFDSAYGRSTSSTRKAKGDEFDSPDYSYFIKIAKLEFAKNFNGPFTFSKKHFKNFPEDVFFQTCTVEKQ